MRRFNEWRRSPSVLPVIRANGPGHYVDLKQRLFRDTFDPGRHTDFDSAVGQQLCREAGVVTCLACGASVIVSAEMDSIDLRCVRCGGSLCG